MFVCLSICQSPKLLSLLESCLSALDFSDFKTFSLLGLFQKDNFLNKKITSSRLNSFALIMSDFVNLPAPLTSYLLNDVSISRTLLNLFLNWNCLGFAVRTFRRNKIVAYSAKIDHYMHKFEYYYPWELQKQRWYKWWWKPQWQWVHLPLESCWWYYWRCWQDRGRQWQGWSSFQEHSLGEQESWSKKLSQTFLKQNFQFLL